MYRTGICTHVYIFRPDHNIKVDLCLLIVKLLTTPYQLQYTRTVS